ncbi:MAG TPA: type I restriction enzyme HsdR N-terminal domain-containing protein [Flavisolibacter sp.]|jgi:hypothetical protein|nr:type I restriction enzyme HsdR N-terminal domain-containing protein [Flavisolibacter sp.]
MIPIRFPEPQFRLKKEGGQTFVFDTIRRSWIQMTEEEWVRQNFVAYLVQTLGYPSSLIALEKEIQLHELRKRFDILVYDRHHQPWMLVECKAPEVPLNESVLQQVLRYNMSVPVHYIIITNGHVTMGWAKTAGTLKPLETLPALP